MHERYQNQLKTKQERKFQEKKKILEGLYMEQLQAAFVTKK